MSMPGWLVITALLALLGIAAWGSWQLWQQLDGVAIEMHGQIALALGGSLALLMTVLFMVLIYVSRTRGFDGPEEEQAQDALPDETRR
jgi:type VI protein secretion system component VasK